MDTPTPLSASCLCGAVKINAMIKSLEIGVCHCGMCRQWAGSPYFAIESDNVTLSGDSVKAYESSEWAERGFCGDCGTHLFYRMKGSETHYLPVGLFPTHQAMTMSHQIFIDSKPEYYSFEQKTVCMTGEEVMAQFAGDNQS